MGFGIWIFYALGAFIIMFVVPLGAILTKGDDGKPRFSSETRRLLLYLYLAVIGMVVGLVALVKYAMLD